MEETTMIIQKNIENCSLNEIKDVFSLTWRQEIDYFSITAIILE